MSARSTVPKSQCTLYLDTNLVLLMRAERNLSQLVNELLLSYYKLKSSNVLTSINDIQIKKIDLNKKLETIKADLERLEIIEQKFRSENNLKEKE